MLTPSEIEWLRQNKLEVGRRAKAYFESRATT
jgi:hypothetical protein